jgi:molybdenum cofactor cytidylyltransferase
MVPLDCIIPAAGESRRMGRWKPVIPFRGRTILETVVSTALEACARVILVTGYRGAELEGLFRGEKRVLVVHNPDWRLGMFSSIQAGLGALSSARFYICLGDLPFIRADVYRALLGARAADAVFPVHGGRRGHPVLLSRKAAAAAREADPVHGRMKDIISGMDAVEIPWPDDSIFRDIDSPEDLSSLTTGLSEDTVPGGGGPS